MAYVTATEVRQILTADPDNPDPGSAASLSEAQLGEAIEEAQQEVDARLGIAWSTPFDADGATVPGLVKRVTRDIAAWLATLTFRRNASLDRDDPVQRRYDAAQRLLADAQNGKVDVSDDAAKDQTEGGAAVTVNINEGRLFTADTFGLRASVEGVSELAER